MQKFLIALSIFAASIVVAHAGDKLVWQGDKPTAYAIGPGGGPCYPTIHMTMKDGVAHFYSRNIECFGRAAGLSDIGVPIGEPLVNMTGIREAHHVKILPNGHIKLY